MYSRRHFQDPEIGIYHLSGHAEGAFTDKGSMDRSWALFAEIFQQLEKTFDHSLQSFVLMPNHFHCMVELSPNKLEVFLKALQEGLCELGFPLIESIDARKILNRYAYKQVSDYIYLNPVKAGLCTRLQDYKYSTYYELLGAKPGQIFKIDDKSGLIYNPIIYR